MLRISSPGSKSVMAIMTPACIHQSITRGGELSSRTIGVIQSRETETSARTSEPRGLHPGTDPPCCV